MGIWYLNISFWKPSPVKEATIHMCNFEKEYITHILSLLIGGECLLFHSSLPVLLSPLVTSTTAFMTLALVNSSLRNLVLTTITTRTFLSLSWEYWNSPTYTQTSIFLLFPLLCFKSLFNCGKTYRT